MLYAAKVKVLAACAYIGSVTTERGEIVLRLVEGLRFDRQKIEPVLRDGIRVGNNQLGLSRRRLGREWRDVLVDVLKQAG